MAEKKTALRIPMARPIEGSVYEREDGVVFTYTNGRWEKENETKDK